MTEKAKRDRWRTERPGRAPLCALTPVGCRFEFTACGKCPIGSREIKLREQARMNAEDDCNHQRLEALRALGIASINAPARPRVVWCPNNLYDEAVAQGKLPGPEGMYRPRREMPVMPENRGE